MRGVGELPVTPRQDRIRAPGFSAGSGVCFAVLSSAQKRGARLESHPGAFVETSHAQPFPAVPRSRRTVLEELRRARGQHRQRDQIEAVVLHHRFEAARIASSYEVKVARGNFETRNVAFAEVPAEDLLE